MGLKKLHRTIKFKQKIWLKSYIDINTDLRIEVKDDFEKYSIKLMNIALFGETMENMRKHRDVRNLTTEARRNYLVSEQNCHTIFFP